MIELFLEGRIVQLIVQVRIYTELVYYILMKASVANTAIGAAKPEWFRAMPGESQIRRGAVVKVIFVEH